MNNTASIQLNDDEMQILPKSIFSKELIIPCDLFLKLGQSHYVKVSKAENENNLSQFSFFSQGHDFLFIKKIDLPAFIQRKLEDLKNNFHLVNNFEAATTLLLQSFNTCFYELGKNRPNPEMLKHVEEIRPYIQQLAETSPHLQTLIVMMNQDREVLATHSFMVTLISMEIALDVGLRDHDLVAVYLGSYFHDIGLFLMSPKVFENLHSTHLAQSEKKELETHPGLGAALIKEMDHVPDSVYKIIEQHHENNFGTGYPRGLKKDQIHDLAKIISLADMFTDLIHGSIDQEPMTPTQAVNYLSNVKAHSYDEKYFKSLQKIVKNQSW